MRNDFVHIMPHMYYTNPVPRSRSIFSLSPTDRLRHRYEQELAEHKAYGEEMVEQRYQHGHYNELLRRRQAEQQRSAEEEREHRRLASEEQQRRQRTEREQTVRKLLHKEEREREKARFHWIQATELMYQPRMRSKLIDSIPQEVFSNYGIQEEVEVESNNEEYSVSLFNAPRAQIKPSFLFSKPIYHEERI